MNKGIRYRIRHRDGSLRSIYSRGKIFWDPQGRPQRWLGIDWDVTGRKQAEEKLVQYNQRLHELTRQLMQAQELERQRLTRELHDEIGQSLTALKLNLQSSLACLDAHPVFSQQPAQELATDLDDALRLTGKLLDQVRDLSLALRPALLDDFGLEAAIRWYLERIGRKTDLAIFCEIPDDLGRFASEIETVFFRTAQEAVTNVLRHAHAQHLWVQLARRAGRLELHVTDDGCGFKISAAETDRLGVRGMRERASLIEADLEIETALGKGTRISLSILPGPASHPLQTQPAAED